MPLSESFSVVYSRSRKATTNPPSYPWIGVDDDMRVDIQNSKNDHDTGIVGRQN